MLRRRWRPTTETYRDEGPCLEDEEALMRPGVRVGVVVLAVIFVLARLAVGDAAEKVSVGLDFTISGYHAPFFVAQEKGYFSQSGLDVTITRGYGSGDTVKKLASGVIDVGFHHPAPLVIANAEGANLRIVMGYLNQEMCATYSAAEDGNVRKPKDIEGQI